MGSLNLEHVGDQLRGDRLAALGLAVLAGVAVVRYDGGDPLGRGAAGRVDHDQLLHDNVVHGELVGGTVGLDDEDGGTADVLAELRVDLAVGELAQHRMAPLYYYEHDEPRAARTVTH